LYRKVRHCRRCGVRLRDQGCPWDAAWKGDSMMQYRVFQAVVAVVLVAGLSGCKCLSGGGEKKEAPAQAVTLADVPAPAKAAIDKLMAGGEIAKIEKEGEGDKAIYDVEGKMKDKSVEYDVAADGTVLSTEESVPYASVPAAVRTAAARYFGSSDGLVANKEVEKGKTYYEVEGKKDGTAITLKLTDTGKIIEKEKE
jgi:uncharacterized membrane protein YkoI